MLYAAYGSNLSIKQMELRCPDARLICTGKLVGWKLTFNIHADIICTGNNNDIVPVVLWDISDKDLRNLDRYEGYPNYYVKADITVELDENRKRKNKKDNTRVLAIAYIMNKKRKGIFPPMQDYFNIIEEGYIDNGIDVKYLYDALVYSIENKTEYNQYNPKKENKLIGVNNMRRNKEAYMNYVCPRCFNTVNKCTCKLYPPHALIMIDRGIQEHIRILNQKGYYTQFCCESHYQESYSLYISFCRDYDFKTIPDGFKYSKNHNNLHCDFTKKISESEYEIIKKERLDSLLDWCKSLENIKPEKPNR